MIAVSDNLAGIAQLLAAHGMLSIRDMVLIAARRVLALEVESRRLAWALDAIAEQHQSVDPATYPSHVVPIGKRRRAP